VHSVLAGVHLEVRTIAHHARGVASFRVGAAHDGRTLNRFRFPRAT
jgi:hypothetical protein